MEQDSAPIPPLTMILRLDVIGGKREMCATLILVNITEKIKQFCNVHIYATELSDHNVEKVTYYSRTRTISCLL